MLYNTQLLEKGLRATFQTAYGSMITQPHLAAVQSLFTPAPSGAASEKYAWLGAHEIEQAAEPCRRVTEVAGDDGVVTHNEKRQSKFIGQCFCQRGFSIARWANQ